LDLFVAAGCDGSRGSGAPIVARTAGTELAAPSGVRPSGVPPSRVRGDPVVEAAGDIACEASGRVTSTTCQQKATSDLLLRQPLAAVLALGDEQYVEGRATKFLTQYGPTWGRLLTITHPVPGDHEYASGGAYGYFAYFGPAAGDPKRGYYSFNLGAWHIIALNSVCEAVGGCANGSVQEQWLAADLKAHPSRCTLAFWHDPRFSSGGDGDDPEYTAFWDDLYAAGAELILNGNDHSYERFAPQNPKATPSANGIQEFVVGTGGKSLTGFRVIRSNSQVRSSTFGVLKLQLHPTSYDWKFVPIAGSRFTDSGRASCH
jgi:hypothetical protein